MTKTKFKTTELPIQIGSNYHAASDRAMERTKLERRYAAIERQNMILVKVPKLHMTF